MKLKTFATVFTMAALTMIGCGSNPVYTVAHAPVL